jgi:hypothetical protein
MIAFVCTIDVANIDKSMQAAIGGRKAALPGIRSGVGWTAYFKIPKAMSSLFQDKNAK